MLETTRRKLDSMYRGEPQPGRDGALHEIEDEIDEQVLPLFLEESVDLMRDIGGLLRDWRSAPENAETARTLQRALHTLKGSARMAGAMGCGELLHSMEDCT